MDIVKKLSLVIGGVGVIVLGALGKAQATTFNGILQDKSSDIATMRLVSTKVNLGQGTMLGLGTWYQFGFRGAGQPAVGCLPADSKGLGCVPSSAGNSVFVGSPAWQIVAPASGAVLTVTDAFASGDVFNIFNFGTLIGSTSKARLGASCESNPDTCLTNPLMSRGFFNLPAGEHSITIVPTASPMRGGAAYFRVEANAVKSVPEPTSVVGVLAVGALGAGWRLKRSMKSK